MRVAIVCNQGQAAQVFASKLQREFAAHGVVSETEALSLADALERAEGFDALLLLPQVAYARRDVWKAARKDATTYVLAISDYRRQNAKKVANDVLRLRGE